MKKHKCKIGYSVENDAREKFYADCTTLKDVEDYEKVAYNKAVDDFTDKFLIELSESVIWGMLIECHKDNSFSDTSNKIVDYVVDTANKVSEQLKGAKQNEDFK